MTAATLTNARARPPAALRPTCNVCQERPTLGALSRCSICIRQAADVDRAQRDALRIAFEARAAQAEAAAIAGKTKACRTCKREKPLAGFHKHRLAQDGHRKDCAACVKAAKVAPKGRTPQQLEADRVAHKKPGAVLVNRASVANWSARNPLAVTARHRLKAAVDRGVVKAALTCEARSCSTQDRLQGHHNNYSQPLRVNWLCPRHHRRLHASRIRLPLKITAVTKYARVPSAPKAKP